MVTPGSTNINTTQVSGGSSAGGGGYTAAASIISSLGSIYTTYESGKLRRVIAEHNAVMAEYDAWFAKFAAEKEEQAVDRDVARLLGRARAINSASGFATDSKTNLDVEGDIMTGAALDVAVIRTRGSWNAFRARSQAGSSRMEGNLARAETAIDTTRIIAEALGERNSSLFKTGSGEKTKSTLFETR